MTDYGYHSIPGSAGLRTRGRDEDPAVRELEALDPLAAAGREVGGEWLSRAVVRSGFAPVLVDVFDRLMPDQEPEEAAVYLQLYRLSFGEERNWARVARRDLRGRTRLSERRLGGALAGLVEKGHIRLVHRDRQGTLYRVLLPHEVFGEADPDHVLAPRRGAGARRAAVPRGTDLRAAEPTAAEPTAAEPTAAEPTAAEPTAAEPMAVDRRGPDRRTQARPPARQIDYDNNTLSKKEPIVPSPDPEASLTVGELAARFVATYGGKGRSKVEVVEEILGRLEEGRQPSEVQSELERFGKGSPRSTPISELARWLARRA